MQQGFDTSAEERPNVHVQQLAYIVLRCTELSRGCRPDLSGELWREVDAMRDAATLTSPSSSRSVLDENRTPSHFICPISQDVMNDPHIAADGFTYEAEAIRGWLGTGHDTSPMTNLPLQHDELTPNLALRSATGMAPAVEHGAITCLICVLFSPPPQVSARRLLPTKFMDLAGKEQLPINCTILKKITSSMTGE